MAELQTLIDRVFDAMERATKAGTLLANGMSLATVGADGRPSVRVVLLKDADARGFVFYTNMGSRKAHELEENPRACLNFWWETLQEQVRIEGVVQPVSESEADAYFATRPRRSQLGAWASRQSEEMSSRELLLAAFAKYEVEFEGRDVPRPGFWSGYRLLPDRIEFWHGDEDRLHDRFDFRLEGGEWVEHLLYP